MEKERSSYMIVANHCCFEVKRAKRGKCGHFRSDLYVRCISSAQCKIVAIILPKKKRGGGVSPGSLMLFKFV